MKIRLLYFASVRESLGMDGETRSFGRDVTDVATLVAALRQEAAPYRTAFSEPEHLRFALDQQFVDGDACLHDGAEVGIFPPVTGG